MDMYDFGRRLRYARERRGLSLRAIGKVAGVSDRTVYKWEHGYNTPYFATMIPVADALGVSLDWLAGRNKPKGR